MAERRAERGLPMTLVIVGACLAVAAAALVLYVRGMGFSAAYAYQPADRNPLMGFAARADSKTNAAEQELVYIDVTWAEWEPEEGVYDIKALEKANNVQRWRSEGKHAVLRFVCDKPGDEEHMDIPMWLYERTGDGVFYDMAYGKGYCPEYSNTEFKEAHTRALKALGAWASRTTFVSYVELGSLGHWGEWHTHYTSGVPAMPDERTCREYVRQYRESFPGARLLMRRNYAMGVEAGAGVYNDMTGEPQDTLEWLGWQEQGGAYEALGHVLPYEPVDQVWQGAPVGGEFTSSLTMDYMLAENLEQTLELIRSSHMTFLGPKYPKGEYAELPGTAAVQGLLGYRIWIERMDVTFNAAMRCWDMTMVWRNDGAAPLYFSWPVTLEIRDASGEVAYEAPLGIDLTKLGSGCEIEVKTSVPFDQRFWEGFTVGVGITDPMTRDYAVQLSMDAPYEAGLNVLYVDEGR